MNKICRVCNKIFDNKVIRNEKGQFIRKGNFYCSSVCKHKDYLLFKKNEREKKWFNGKREDILSRDNFSCVVCGNKEDLVVHHKDGKGRGNKNPNNTLNNLTTLCLGCHTKLHLTKFQKIEIYSKIIELWKLSNREIGRKIGCTHPTVAILRKQIIRAGDLL